MSEFFDTVNGFGDALSTDPIEVHANSRHEAFARYAQYEAETWDAVAARHRTMMQNAEKKASEARERVKLYDQSVVKSW